MVAPVSSKILLLTAHQFSKMKPQWLAIIELQESPYLKLSLNNTSAGLPFGMKTPKIELVILSS